MSRAFFILIFGLFTIAACNNKAQTTEEIKKPTETAKVETNVAKPIDTPPADILAQLKADQAKAAAGTSNGSLAGAALGTITNPIMNGLQEALYPGGAPPQRAQAPPRKPEPPQNAAGVWHYTCPKGCSGGAGAAQACASCGERLQHNQAYHN